MNQLLLDVKKDVEKQLYQQLVALGDDVKHLSMLAANRFPAEETFRKAG